MQNTQKDDISSICREMISLPRKVGSPNNSQFWDYDLDLDTKRICTNCQMYLYKWYEYDLRQSYVWSFWDAGNICPDCKMYLFRFQNVFV